MKSLQKWFELLKDKILPEELNLLIVSKLIFFFVFVAYYHFFKLKKENHLFIILYKYCARVDSIICVYNASMEDGDYHVNNFYSENREMFPNSKIL